MPDVRDAGLDRRQLLLQALDAQILLLQQRGRMAVDQVDRRAATGALHEHHAMPGAADIYFLQLEGLVPAACAGWDGHDGRSPVRVRHCVRRETQRRKLLEEACKSPSVCFHI